MNVTKKALLASIVIIQGCASAWISNPSPVTRDLIHDLRLEGYTCIAKTSAIICTQTVPHHTKQPAICSGDHGCIEQPDLLTANQYTVTQQPDGIPSISHRVVREEAPSP